MSGVRWFVFDAYGTLLDVDSATARSGPESLPPGLIATWRAKQLEYTWTLQAMGAYRDFELLTAEALEYACAATGTSAAQREALLDAYVRLDPFAEVADVLSALKSSGMRLAVLSNGTASMLARALDSAGVAAWLDEVISVDEIRIYKPDPRVYAHALARLGAEASEVRFVSSNAWDAAGAQSAGLGVTWVNRLGRPDEYGLAATAGQGPDLRQLRPAARPGDR